jgi:hypothetical protein
VYYGKPRNEHGGNQIYFHRQTIKDYLKQQQTLNEELVAYMKQFNKMIHETKLEQVICNESFSSQLNKQEEVYHNLLNKIEKEESVKEAILDSLMLQEAATNKLSQKLANQEQLYNGLLARLESQEKLFTKLAEKLALQEVFHQTLMEKLEQQEAANFKVERQLDSLKENMFERFAYMTEKVENNFKHMFRILIRFFTRQDKHHKQAKKRFECDIRGESFARLVETTNHETHPESKQIVKV